MNSTESALVVLIDGEDVKHVFSTWPNDICLAACLMRDGDCSMIVFRRDERPRIPARLVQTLGLAAREVCSMPWKKGWTLMFCWGCLHRTILPAKRRLPILCRRRHFNGGTVVNPPNRKKS
jgi:hypothetical protein